MLNKKEWQWPVAFVCLCLGFLLAVQLRTQSVLRRDTLPSRRIDALTELLRQAERENEALSEENRSLRTAVAGQASSRASTRELVSELQRAQVLAGLTKVTGPGVVIILSDSDRQARAGENEDVYLIHADDLLATVNELRVAGAEAIAVNGQRVVASTAIRCVGVNILVNTARVSPPFIIEAIGDRDNLMQVNMRGAELDILRAWGIKVQIEPREVLTLPPYSGSVGASYAKPVLGGDG
ncbi:MAG: DUF881 domain-containing protein [Patescibacteria group bacterium]